jgi:hypothetical protein
MQLLVLVDYDNVKVIRKERSPQEVAFNVETIALSAAHIRERTFPDFKDVRLRFYGGWTDSTGARLERGAWVSEACEKIRGRRLGGRITAEMAYGLFDSVYSIFYGLYRDGGQKIVDTLIVADAIRIAIVYGSRVLIMSDDEDMLPGLLGCHVHNPRGAIARFNRENVWHNDAMISHCGAIIESGGVA